MTTYLTISAITAALLLIGLRVNRAKYRNNKEGDVGLFIALVSAGWLPVLVVLATIFVCRLIMGASEVPKPVADAIDELKRRREEAGKVD